MSSNLDRDSEFFVVLCYHNYRILSCFNESFHKSLINRSLHKNPARTQTDFPLVGESGPEQQRINRYSGYTLPQLDMLQR